MDQRCRFCGVNINKPSKFFDVDENSKLKIWIRKHFKVDLADGHSKRLCHDCLETTKDFIKFHATVQSKQRLTFPGPPFSTEIETQTEVTHFNDAECQTDHSLPSLDNFIVSTPSTSSNEAVTSSSTSTPFNGNISSGSTPPTRSASNISSSKSSASISTQTSAPAGSSRKRRFNIASDDENDKSYTPKNLKLSLTKRKSLRSRHKTPSPKIETRNSSKSLTQCSKLDSDENSENMSFRTRRQSQKKVTYKGNSDSESEKSGSDSDFSPADVAASESDEPPSPTPSSKSSLSPTPSSKSSEFSDSGSESEKSSSPLVKATRRIVSSDEEDETPQVSTVNPLRDSSAENSPVNNDTADKSNPLTPQAVLEDKNLACVLEEEPELPECEENKEQPETDIVMEDIAEEEEEAVNKPEFISLEQLTQVEDQSNLSPDDEPVIPFSVAQNTETDILSNDEETEINPISTEIASKTVSKNVKIIPITKIVNNETFKVAESTVKEISKTTERLPNTTCKITEEIASTSKEVPNATLPITSKEVLKCVENVPSTSKATESSNVTSETTREVSSIVNNAESEIQTSSIQSSVKPKVGLVALSKLMSPSVTQRSEQSGQDIAAQIQAKLRNNQDKLPAAVVTLNASHIPPLNISIVTLPTSSNVQVPSAIVRPQTQQPLTLEPSTRDTLDYNKANTIRNTELFYKLTIEDQTLVRDTITKHLREKATKRYPNIQPAGQNSNIENIPSTVVVPQVINHPQTVQNPVLFQFVPQNQQQTHQNIVTMPQQQQQQQSVVTQHVLTQTGQQLLIQTVVQQPVVTTAVVTQSSTLLHPTIVSQASPMVVQQVIQQPPVTPVVLNTRAVPTPAVSRPQENVPSVPVLVDLEKSQPASSSVAVESSRSIDARKLAPDTLAQLGLTLEGLSPGSPQHGRATNMQLVKTADGATYLITSNVTSKAVTSYLLKPQVQPSTSSIPLVKHTYLNKTKKNDNPINKIQDSAVSETSDKSDSGLSNRINAAIGSVLRGPQNKTIKPKEVDKKVEEIVIEDSSDDTASAFSDSDDEVPSISNTSKASIPGPSGSNVSISSNSHLINPKPIPSTSQNPVLFSDSTQVVSEIITDEVDFYYSPCYTTKKIPESERQSAVREVMTDLFDNIRTLLPALHNIETVPKIQILKDAKECIEKLKGAELGLNNLKNILNRKNRKLLRQKSQLGNVLVIMENERKKYNNHEK